MKRKVTRILPRLLNAFRLVEFEVRSVPIVRIERSVEADAANYAVRLLEFGQEKNFEVFPRNIVRLEGGLADVYTRGGEVRARGPRRR